MKRILLSGLIAATVFACSKDKFETKPQIKINEFGPEQVVKGQLIQLRATVTDKEGDIQDSLYVVRKRYNVTTNVLLTTDTIRYSLVTLGAPTKTETEIQVRFLYGELQPDIAPIQNLETTDRSYTLGLVIIDKAGNRSDYVESEKIVLKKL